MTFMTWILLQSKKACNVIVYIGSREVNAEPRVNESRRYEVLSQLKSSSISVDQKPVQLQDWPGLIALCAITVHCGASFVVTIHPRYHFARRDGRMLA